MQTRISIGNQNEQPFNVEQEHMEHGWNQFDIAVSMNVLDQPKSRCAKDEKFSSCELLSLIEIIM